MFHHLYERLNNVNYHSQLQHPEPRWVEVLTASLLRDHRSLKLLSLIFSTKTFFYTYRDMIHYSSPILPVLSDGPRQQSEIDRISI